MEGIKEKLKGRSLRATPTRLNVLNLIKNHTGAIPFSQLQKKLSGTDRITLFRTLHVLVDSGLVHKALFHNKETYYAMCQASCSKKHHIHDHFHFKCSVCHEVTCRQLPASINFIAPDLIVEKIDVNVVGICGKCQ